MEQGRARAVAFLCAIEDACAEQLVPTPGGHAVIDNRHPRLWDANHLRVEGPEAPAMDALAAAAEIHFGRLRFRAITVLEESVGEALAAPLHARGYGAYHHLLMLLGAVPPPPDPAIAIAEITSAQMAASRLGAAIEREVGDEEVGRQLASRDLLIDAATDVRWLAVRDGDEIAARCRLFTEGGVAQVENVYTAPAHRSRGFAGALVSHAVRAARAGGAEIVFLVTDADEWPQQLYRRLGFAGAGLLHRFRTTL